MQMPTFCHCFASVEAKGMNIYSKEYIVIPSGGFATARRGPARTAQGRVDGVASCCAEHTNA